MAVEQLQQQLPELGVLPPVDNDVDAGVEDEEEVREIGHQRTPGTSLASEQAENIGRICSFGTAIAVAVYLCRIHVSVCIISKRLFNKTTATQHFPQFISSYIQNYPSHLTTTTPHKQQHNTHYRQ